jgi:hypothetical protein
MITSTTSRLHILYINIGIQTNPFGICIFWTCTWCWTTISKEHFYHFIIRVLLDWRTLLLKAMSTDSIKENSISLTLSYIMFIYIYLKQSDNLKFEYFEHFVPSPNFEVRGLYFCLLQITTNPKINPHPIIIKTQVIL